MYIDILSIIDLKFFNVAKKKGILSDYMAYFIIIWNYVRNFVLDSGSWLPPRR